MKKTHVTLLSLIFFGLLVFLNSCDMGQPLPPEPVPEVKISPNARLIDSTTSQQLLSISSDSSTFTFSTQASAILSLRPNDIMVMQREQGYLRKITSVQQQTNAIMVQTSDASLTDAVERGALTLTGTLVPENVQSITDVLDGVTLKKNVLRTKAFVFEINNLVLYERNGYQVKANGSLQIEPSFHFSIGVENSQLQQLAFAHTIEETANLSLTAEIDFLHIAREYRIARITFSSITVFIGPIPVVITPRLDVYVGIDGNTSASFSSGVTQQATFTAGIRYDNSAWSNSQSLTNSFSFSAPTLTASLQAKGYVETRLELLVYGVLAPRATAEGYLRVAANPLTNPWWSLYGGLGVGAGVSVRILGRTIADYSVPDLIAHERLLASAAASGFWIRRADFGGNERNGATAFSAGSYAYVGTGFVGADSSYSRDFWEYNPSSDTWSRKTDLPAQGRWGAVAFSIAGKGYVTSGAILVSPTQRGWDQALWEYNPLTDNWTRKADFAGQGRDGAVAFSVGSKGYVALGKGATGPLRDLWEYDPTANTWTRKADFPGIPRNDAIGFSIGTKGYVGTGEGLSSPFVYNDFWEYDPSTNTWTRKADFPGTPRAGAVGFSTSSKGYIGTGYDAGANYTNLTNDFWEYDPTTNTWTQKASFVGGSRAWAIAFSIAGKGYLCTGWNGTYRRDFWQFDQ
jgi:N-acetylneuraminic acid mutarotase